MSTAPVNKFGRLSLDNMPPTTRSKSHRESNVSSAGLIAPAAPAAGPPPAPSFPRQPSIIISDSASSRFHSESSSNLSSSDQDEGEPGGDQRRDDEDDEDDADSLAESPSHLLYRLDGLPEIKRTAVRDVFSDPPKVALQHCRRIDDDTYAFQMTELVPRSVRIHRRHDGISGLSCSCGSVGAGPVSANSSFSSSSDGEGSSSGGDDESSHEGLFCPHLVWLLDQVLAQTLYHHSRDDPVAMRSDGYAQELGDPFDSIRRHSLDVLAAGLHCPLVADPRRHGEVVDPTRALEARELLASVYEAEPDHFRPDIFGRRAGRGGGHVGSLAGMMRKYDDDDDEDDEDEKDDETARAGPEHDMDLHIAQMLLDNGHLFNYFLSRSRPSDPVNDIFRKLSQRVDIVVRHFDQQASRQDGADGIVAWAARHIDGCVDLIRSAVFSRRRPLTAPQSLSAASALVHMLEAVATRNRDVVSASVSSATSRRPPRFSAPRATVTAPRAERNLYLRMIGDHDDDFVLGVLALIPQAATQFVHDLESLLDNYITVQGAPATYVSRFRSLLARLRTSRTGAGLKRPAGGASREQGSSRERGSKRMK